MDFSFQLYSARNFPPLDDVLGRVAKLGESYIHVEVASGVELQVQRGAVVQVLPKGTFK